MTTTSQPIFATLFAALRRQGKFFYLLIAQVLLIALFLYLDRPGVPTIVFRSLAVMALLHAVLRIVEMTYDTIYGSLSVYLLMAMTWGFAYLLLVTFQQVRYQLTHSGARITTSTGQTVCSTVS